MIIVEIEMMRNNEVECYIECLWYCIETIQLECECRCHPKNQEID